MATSTVKIDVQVNSKSINDLEKELADINEQLNDVEIGSQAFKDLSKSAQAATAQLEKVNSEVEGFTADKKFMAADGAIKGFAGSISGVVGAFGLLGVESEKLGAFEEKAASAIALSMGLKDMAEGYKMIANAEVLAAAKAKIMGLTTKQALIATGIGAFVVLLGSVIAYWDDIVKGAENLGKKFKLVGVIIDGVKDAFNSFIDAVRPALEYLGLISTAEEKRAEATRVASGVAAEASQRELDLMRARGAAAEEIYAKEIELINQKIAASTDEEEIASLNHDKAVARASETKRLQDEAAKRQAEADAARKKRNEEIAKEKEEEAKRLADEAQKVQDDENDRLQAIEDIRKAYDERRRDDAAETELQKVELEEQRALEDLERLKATEEEKLNIMAYYKELKDIAAEEDRAITNEKNQAIAQEDYDRLMNNLQAEYDAAQQKIAIRASIVDAIANLAGQETAIGKAAFLAQNVIRLMDLKASATAALKKMAIDAGKAGADTASGFAATAKVGFPQNVPMLIAYALQAVGIIAAMKSAFSKGKSAVASAGVGGGGGDISVPSIGGGGVSAPQPVMPAAPAQVTSTTPTIQAYVVSGDVRDGQEADARLRNRRTV